MTEAGDKLKLALEEAINVAKCEHDFWPLPSTEKFYHFMCSTCCAEFSVPRSAFEQESK